MIYRTPMKPAGNRIHRDNTGALPGGRRRAARGQQEAPEFNEEAEAKQDLGMEKPEEGGKVIELAAVLKRRAKKTATPESGEAEADTESPNWQKGALEIPKDIKRGAKVEVSSLFEPEFEKRLAQNQDNTIEKGAARLEELRKSHFPFFAFDKSLWPKIFENKALGPFDDSEYVGLIGVSPEEFLDQPYYAIVVDEGVKLDPLLAGATEKKFTGGILCKQEKIPLQSVVIVDHEGNVKSSPTNIVPTPKAPVDPNDPIHQARMRGIKEDMAMEEADSKKRDQDPDILKKPPVLDRLKRFERVSELSDRDFISGLTTDSQQLDYELKLSENIIQNPDYMFEVSTKVGRSLKVYTRYSKGIFEISPIRHQQGQIDLWGSQEAKEFKRLFQNQTAINSLAQKIERHETAISSFQLRDIIKDLRKQPENEDIQIKLENTVIKNEDLLVDIKEISGNKHQIKIKIEVDPQGKRVLKISPASEHVDLWNRKGSKEFQKNIRYILSEDPRVQQLREIGIDSLTITSQNLIDQIVNINKRLGEGESFKIGIIDQKRTNPQLFFTVKDGTLKRSFRIGLNYNPNTKELIVSPGDESGWKKRGPRKFKEEIMRRTASPMGRVSY